jgi:class 3 adenylate cyclase
MWEDGPRLPDRAPPLQNVTPETRYVLNGAVSIAYQVLGEGPLDIVHTPGWISHLELAWDAPETARWYRGLASFARLIVYDKRGTGMSDRSSEQFSLETRMDDLRAVMDAAGSKRAALFGISEGGPMSLLFAATYPERTSALVIYGSYPRRLRADDYPWGQPEAAYAREMAAVREHWTDAGDDFWTESSPSIGNDASARAGLAKMRRMSATPGAARALLEMNAAIDVRPILGSITVPTLVLHRAGDRRFDVRGARFMAASIPGARFVEVPDDDHIPWLGDTRAILDEVRQFLTGESHAAEPDRVLATVLFTDIVASTEAVQALGDKRWGDLVERHQGEVRAALARYRGKEVKTTGDGFLATFDGPARAIRCAQAIVAEAARMGIAVRAGIHTGETERLGADVGGIAVHIGARVAAHAAAGEVLVSRTVRDLVAGSGVAFADRGTHKLKGVEEEWALYAAVGDGSSASPRG